MHAEAMRARSGTAETEPFDVEAYVQTDQGWTTDRLPLAAAAGGLQACLLPFREGFRLVVDCGIGPGEGWQAFGGGARLLRKALYRSRLAHELAHTFFYRAGRPPARLGRASSLEEKFCDDFSAALLAPPSIALRAYESGARSIVETARYLSLPVQSLLLSAASSTKTFALGGTARFGLETVLTIELVLGHPALRRSWSLQQSLVRLVEAARTTDSPCADFLVTGNLREATVVVSGVGGELASAATT